MTTSRLSRSAIQERIDKVYEERIRDIAESLFEDFQEYLENPTEWKEGKYTCKITDLSMIQYRPAIMSVLKKFFEEDVKVESGVPPHEILILW